MADLALGGFNQAFGRDLGARDIARAVIGEFTPSRRTINAFAGIMLGRASTRAELRAMQKLVLKAAVRGALKNSPWGRVLDLALMAIDVSDFDAPAAAWKGIFPDLNWTAGLGPYSIHSSQVSGIRMYAKALTSASSGGYELLSNPNWDKPFLSAGGWRINLFSTQNNALYSGGQFYTDLDAYRSWLYYSTSTALPMPAVTIVAGAPVVPRVFYPSAALNFPDMSVPYHLLGQAIKWRELVAPRADGKPIRDNGTLSVPVPVPLPAVQITADGRVTTGDPHQFRPPKKGEKEKKGVTSKHYGTRVERILHAAMKHPDMVTEGLDFLDAVYYALPAHLQKRKATPQEKLKLLYRYHDSIDVSDAVRNIVLTNLMDTVSAKASEPLRKAWKQYRPTDPSNRAWMYGPG